MGMTFVSSYFFVIFLILAFLFFRWYIKHNYSYPSIYSKGLEAFNNGEYEKARKLFLACVQKDPASKEARYNLGLTLLNLKQYQAAKSSFEKVLKDNADDFDSMYNLALTNFNMKDYIKAKECFVQLLEKDSSNFNVLFNLGLTCQMQQVYDEADEFYTKASTKNDEDADLYLNWGIVFFEQEQYGRALERFKTANEFSPDNSEILFSIAKCRDELCSYNNDEEAQKVMNRYIELSSREDKPTELEVYMSRSYAKAGKIDVALELCDKTLERLPKNTVLLRLIGLISLLQKDYDRAQEVLNKAINLDSNNMEGYKLLGHVYGQLGDRIKQAETNDKYRKLYEISKYREKMSA